MQALHILLGRFKEFDEVAGRDLSVAVSVDCLEELLRAEGSLALVVSDDFHHRDLELLLLALPLLVGGLAKSLRQPGGLHQARLDLLHPMRHGGGLLGKRPGQHLVRVYLLADRVHVPGRRIYDRFGVGDDAVGLVCQLEHLGHSQGFHFANKPQDLPVHLDRALRRLLHGGGGRREPLLHSRPAALPVLALPHVALPLPSDAQGGPEEHEVLHVHTEGALRHHGLGDDVEHAVGHCERKLVLCILGDLFPRQHVLLRIAVLAEDRLDLVVPVVGGGTPQGLLLRGFGGLEGRVGLVRANGNPPPELGHELLDFRSLRLLRGRILHVLGVLGDEIVARLRPDA
mmetsp:Transcript_44744/g.130261  ORF Transcript_44744/g.130261 Transcript_44744/m.130261 type:complete len:343 (+) Transcript_44744:845-1873(+)